MQINMAYTIWYPTRMPYKRHFCTTCECILTSINGTIGNCLFNLSALSGFNLIETVYLCDNTIYNQIKLRWFAKIRYWA